MTSARNCQQCGKALTPDDRFCPQCGTGQIVAPALPQPSGGPWEGMLDRLARATSPRYRVLRLLGYGGMAGVYLAEEPRLGRRVALKVMAPGLMVDPGLVSRFEQEARTTAQLNHPNIVTIFDVDTKDGLHFFVMAFVAGRTLGQIMAQPAEPLPIQAVLHWFAQAGSGLAYAHRAGIVHRDIKPGNIMVDGYGNALVTDFGIAKVADQPSLTRTGFLVGTPTYMSPEQCADTDVTGASDQYALGIVLYEMLTGRPPFTGATIAVLQAHVGQKPAPLRDLRPDCPQPLADAIERMLLKAPAERFPTVAAAISAAGASVLPEDDPLRDRLGAIAAVADAVELPPMGALMTGETTALGATVRDATGRPLPNRHVRWVSDTPALLSVSEDGVVQALAPGTARVTAWCEGVAATTALQITTSPSPYSDPEDDVALPPSFAATELFTPTPPPQRVEPPTPAPWLAEPTPPAPREPTPPAPREPTPPALHEPTPPALREPTPPALRESTSPALREPTLPALQEPTPVALQEPTPAALRQPEPPLPVWPTQATDPPPRRRTPIVAGVATLVLAIVVTAIVLQRQPSPGNVSSGGPTASDPPAGDGAGGGTAVTPAPVPIGAAIDSSVQEQDSAAAAGPPPAVAAARDSSPTRAATQPPPAPPPAEAPRTGTLRIAGTLPAGAEVVVSGAGIANRRVTGGMQVLPPGSYTVQVRAPGYEPASRQVAIRAGETASWSPDLRAAEAPPVTAEPPPPVTDDAAAAEAVRGVIASFVQALASRDLDAIERTYPGAGGAWRRQWSPFFENTRDVRNLAARLIAVNSLSVEGEVARATFTVELQYEDFRNRSNRPRFDFQATLNRAAGSWTLSELTQAQ